MKILFTVIFIFFSTTIFSIPPKNFQEAKRAARVIWNEHRQTFYCGCQYDKHGIIREESCCFKIKHHPGSLRISWEHVVPASRLGQSLPCWKEPLCGKNEKRYKGRACCQKISPEFRKMESDLHNLVPAIKEVNAKRRNYGFAEFPLGKNPQKHYFKGCHIIIDERYGLVEPRDEVKGMVARIYFYMAGQYNLTLTEYEQRLFTLWDKRFPPSEWEKRWNEKVAQIQGES